MNTGAVCIFEASIFRHRGIQETGFVSETEPLEMLESMILSITEDRKDKDKQREGKG